MIARCLVIAAFVLIGTGWTSSASAFTKSEPVRSEHGYSIFLSFSSESDLEQYHHDNIGKFIEDLKDYLFSTAEENVSSDDKYRSIKENYDVRFHRGLFPFVRDVQAKLFSKIPATFPVCNDLNPNGTCADAAEPPQTARDATNAWLKVCGDYETVARIWIDTIYKDHLALRKAEYAANPDKRWEAEFIDGSETPFHASFEWPFLGASLPIGTTQHFGGGPIILDGLGIVHHMVAGQKRLVFSGAAPTHPCLRAVSNMFFGSGAFRDAGVEDVDPGTYFVYPFDIPGDLCADFDLDLPPPPSPATHEQVNNTCFQNYDAIMFNFTDENSVPTSYYLRQTQGMAEKIKEQLRNVEGPGARPASETLSKGSAFSLPLPFSDISGQQIIGRIIRSVLGIVGALAFGFLVYGGVLWMTAAGNQDRITRAKATIVWSVLGIVIIFAAYAITNFIVSALAG